MRMARRPGVFLVVLIPRTVPPPATITVGDKSVALFISERDSWTTPSVQAGRAVSGALPPGAPPSSAGSSAPACSSFARPPPGSAAIARVAVAGHLQQVGAHGVQAVVAGQPLVEAARAARARPPDRRPSPRRWRGSAPPSGCRSSAPAGRRARGSAASRCPRPSRASSCTAAIAACSWYSPTAPVGSAAATSATPSAISARSQSERSCSASGISSPSGPVRAGRRASVSSISASRPATSGSSGQRRVHDPRQPDRLARQLAAREPACRCSRRSPR